MSEQFVPGTVVQLRSGGPLLTVNYSTTAQTSVVYFNPISGMYDTFVTPHICLREANAAPQTPANASGMRHTSVAKSSL